MAKPGRNRTPLLRAGAVLAFVVAFGFVYFQTAADTSGKSSPEVPVEIAKYSEFPHSKHKQACDACHKFPSSNWKAVRAADAAFPDITDYPRHESCLNCHRRQFFGRPRPVICRICHTNPSPRNSARHPFPNPREIFDESPKGKNATSDFEISFPHETHVDIVGQNRRPATDRLAKGSYFVRVSMTSSSEESCSVCHQTYKPQGESDGEYLVDPPEDLGDRFWLKKGTFKTSPIGHATCFTCHSEDTGILPAPQNCAVCHKLKQKAAPTDFDPKSPAALAVKDKVALTAWRKRDSSATFRHEWFSHKEMECAMCHDAKAMDTLNRATKKVKVLSCAGCHITATADEGGILNYEIDSRKADASFKCTKCHIAYGSAVIPESHFKAVAEQAGQ